MNCTATQRNVWNRLKITIGYKQKYRDMTKIEEIIQNARQQGGIKRGVIRLEDFNTGVRVFEKIANARLADKNQQFVHCNEVDKLVDWLYCKSMFDTDYNKGILIKGTTGKGKTFLMDVFSDFCRLDEPQYVSFGEKRNVRPIKANARQIAIEFSNNGLEGIERYFEINSLFIDDIGAEQKSNFYGNKVSVITEILDRREERNLLTFGTTNCDKLTEIYDDRTVSRIASMFNIWYIENKNDYRINPNKKLHI